jgi:hypothetical protein
MLMRLSRFVAAFAICVAIGGHWLALQSIAWATMVVNYSQHCSLGQAIVETFDGKHPCGLCKEINKAKNTEKRQDAQPSADKADLICTIRRVVLLPPFSPFNYPEFASSLICGSEQPLSPPPRALRT